jgi:primosomal protein N' (replication factor Y)
MKKQYLQVALPTPLRQTFDYLPSMENQAEPGMRVKVPFGRRDLIGVVMSSSDTASFDESKLKIIKEVLDEQPLLGIRDLQLAEFAANYYHHPIGDVVSSMLPTQMRQGRPATIKKAKEEKEPKETEAPLSLNQEQKTALNKILQHKDTFKTFLLQGVTGSGKTEVYLQAITEVLKDGKQALILVPEISLTPQTVMRFEKRFNVPISVMHSNLSDGPRAQAWLKAHAGQAKIIIGTRSAIFTPMPDLGLVIIDEEHDLSFKQQEGFRYHARDLAIWRANQLGIPVVLGSATPSFESLYHAQQGKYQLLTLTQRINQNAKTQYHLIDLKMKKLEAGLSTELLQAIELRLKRDEQVLLFLNRRGYAPTWMCHFCGWVANCPRCDSRLTFHANKRLVCHHCEYQMRENTRCKECGSESHVLLGEGTQRIEEVLQQHFPDAPVIRIDRDSMRKKDSLTNALEKINSNECKILLGTQILAKGHHFPQVTLVGVIDADTGLMSSDFRAAERMAQLLTQVAGRAGREQLAGEVYIQTHHPEHPLLRQLLKEGYASFAQSALAERKSMQLPPYGHMALLRAESVKADAPMSFLTLARDFSKQLPQEVACMGPVPAVMEKRQGKYRAQLMLHANNRSALHPMLSQLTRALEDELKPKQVRWNLDIDPQNFD